MEWKTQRLVKKLTTNRGRKSYIEIAMKVLCPCKRKLDERLLYSAVLDRWIDFRLGIDPFGKDPYEMSVLYWSEKTGTNEGKRLFLTLFYLNDMATLKEVSK